MTDAVDVVLGYAQAGVPILPLHTMRGDLCTCGRPAGKGPGACHSPAKHPLTRAGKDDATCDPGTIAEWLARWPGCNWGVRPPVGVVVLDVDPRNGGDDQLAQLQARHGALPPTLTARTGSGGLHLWFSYNGPARGKLCTGVDVKTNTGYLVAPPSVHECGGIYEWTDRRPAQYAPAWVREILNPPTRRYPVRPGSGGSIAHLVAFVASSPEGTRNSRLYWAACRAHEIGADPAPLIDAAVSIGLVHGAAEATVRSAGRATPRTTTRSPAAAELLGTTEGRR